MKKLLSVIGAASALVAHPFIAQATEDYFVFRARASIPVLEVVSGQAVDKIAKMVLTGNDIVNLALGRSLDTKVNPKTEILAVAAPFVVGLASKPMVITLPFVLLLLDYWPRARMRGNNAAAEQTNLTFPWSRLALEKVPLLVI